jgi:hypothetical protein
MGYRRILLGAAVLAAGLGAVVAFQRNGAPEVAVVRVVRG